MFSPADKHENKGTPKPPRVLNKRPIARSPQSLGVAERCHGSGPELRCEDVSASAAAEEIETEIEMEIEIEIEKKGDAGAGGSGALQMMCPSWEHRL